MKDAHPGMQIAVGGCLAQKDRGTIVEQAPWVDVVFGTHNIGKLPVLLERARVQDEAQVEIARVAGGVPLDAARRAASRAYAAWVSISVGCNNTCTFCIVPALRGKEKDRRPGDILAEVEALVAEGVIEITLLGQNVNAYGSDLGDREAFGKLLRACGEIEGLERVRFTSPHPRDFTDDVIAAMAETPNVMPQLHMPLQSGSDAVLKAMRRSYRQERFLGIIEKVRAAIPDAAISTDIIVGFPGETEEDFEQTLHVGARGALRERVHLPVLASAPARPPPTMDGPDPQGGRPGALRAARRPPGGDLLGGEQEAGRPHPGADGRRGRGPQGRRHPPAVRPRPRQPAGALRRRTPASGPATSSTVEITYAAPHHLLAEGPLLGHRRTRAGRRGGGAARAPGVPLGMPGIGAPAWTSASGSA